MKSVLINLLSFKAGWAASVLTAAAAVPAAGVAAAGAVVALHLSRTERILAEALLLVSAAVIGLTWESLLVAFGLLEYETGFFAPGLAPYWIVAMWVLFATTLNVGMRWLRKGTLIAAVAGAIGGPLAFYAGASAGAVELADPLLSLIVIGIGWAILLPVLVKLATYFDGHPAHAERADDRNDRNRGGNPNAQTA